MNLGEFGLGVGIWAVISRMWSIVMAPFRAIGSPWGMGGLFTLVVIYLIGSAIIGGGQYGVHGLRNLYLATFTDRVPVPLGMDKVLERDLVYDVTVSRPSPSLDTDAMMEVTLANRSAYPVTRVALYCDVYSRMYSESQSMNTDYLFHGIMKPGETRTFSVPFNGPAGGPSFAKCKYLEGHTTYSWWEGFPLSEVVKGGFDRTKAVLSRQNDDQPSDDGE